MGIVYAAAPNADACSLIGKINQAILYPLIALLLAAALLMFLWGVFQYIVNAEGDDARDTGRKHMIFGVIGLVIMVSALAILRIATNTFGIGIPLC